MDVQTTTKQNPIVRQLASLKILSRLLALELHAQGGAKSVQLSREEVLEVQTTLDLFIDEFQRRHGNAGTPAPEPQMVTARGLDGRN